MYHHTLVVLLTWVGMNFKTSTQWMAVLFNTFVHTFMYSHYFLATLHISAWWKIYLTQLQMIQFTGLCSFLGLWFYWNTRTPGGCGGEEWAFYFCLFGNVTFLLLFLHFYINTYFRKGSHKKEE